MRNLKLIALLLCSFPALISHGQEVASQPSQRLFSEILQENRTLQLHLPETYGSTNRTYPVLFVLDSEYIFEYAKGAIKFLSNEFGFHPELIVVGIPNTDRNRDLYVDPKPNGSYLKFVGFLEKELLPYVQNNYRTNGFNMLYGWSSGAGMVNYAMVKKPKLFDAYIMAGSGIGPNTEAFIKREMDSTAYEHAFLFASAEGTTERVNGLKRHQGLVEEFSPKGLSWEFKVYPKLDHVGAMSQGLYDGFEFVFKDFHIPDSIIPEGSQKILTYYQNLQNKYGYMTEIPVGAVNEICGILIYQEKVDEAQKLIDYGLGIYPESHTLWATKAELHQGLNQVKKAIKYYQMAQSKATDIHAKNKYKILLTTLGNKQEK